MPNRSTPAKIVGVLGGMGPEAALEFCRRLLARTPGVRRDQDHLHVILDNNAQIPDRTAAILGTGKSPAPEAARSARLLERAGADLIAMPCNTIHRWYGEVRRAVKTPVIHLIDTTVEAARAKAGGKAHARSIGVLATDGTLRMGLYEEALAHRSLRQVAPTPAEQSAVMVAIRGIKAGRSLAGAKRTVKRVGQALVRRGAQAVVIGCTEISLALADGDLSVPVVDSLDALVAETLRRAGVGKRRKKG